MNASSEDLNKYSDSYQAEFKFNDENSWTMNWYGQHIKRAILEKQAQKALSLGIGHAFVSSVIADSLKSTLKQYVILEGAESIIARFNKEQEYASLVDTIHTYFEEYSTDERFDVIEMGFVLEHVEDPLFILNKYKNFLSPKGSIYIGVPNAGSLHRQIGFQAGMMKDIHTLSEHDLQLGHRRYFDTISLKKLVADAGLRVVDTRGLFLKPITTSQMVQLGWSDNIIKALLQLGDKYPELSNAIMMEVAL